MPYPTSHDLRKLAEQAGLYAQVKHEYGAEGVERVLAEVRECLKGGVGRLRSLPVDAVQFVP